MESEEEFCSKYINRKWHRKLKMTISVKQKNDNKVINKK